MAAPPMHPLPSGTRDVLPDEMRELRAVTEAMRRVFTEHGYGEVWTPAIEYETVGVALDGGSSVYRLVDDHGGSLRLKSDLTVPIARLAATRYATDEPPLRFSSLAHVYRGVKPHRGEMREMLQAGCELIGSGAPDGTVEVLTVLTRALEATGLKAFRIGLGDAALYPALLDAQGVDGPLRHQMLDALLRRDFVALSELVVRHDLDELLLTVPQRRGGPEVLQGLDLLERLRGVHAGLAPDVAERIIFDLGLTRDLTYYTGAVFEVYDPGAGAPLGGGGRYDDLLGKFGRDLPAVGFAINVDRLHLALAGEERGERIA
jgi:ATP phosphoribosyltransferase regulatory subunit